MRVQFTEVSNNKKVGPIPVSTSEQSTCPNTCPLKDKGCYANTGPISWHWRKVGTVGIEWEQFLHRVQALGKGQLWRHNQAGDLPGDGNLIDAEKLQQLTQANKGRRGFTFSHYRGHENLQAIAAANRDGFTVNLSADNLTMADELKAANAGPVVVVMPADFIGKQLTPAGHKVIACPASVGLLKNCNQCQVCQKADRKSIIGFPAHGQQKVAAEKISLEV